MNIEDIRNMNNISEGIRNFGVSLEDFKIDIKLTKEDYGKLQSAMLVGLLIRRENV